jgi:DNA-binding transcriptional regulator YdaS (Cro superfamily)
MKPYRSRSEVLASVIEAGGGPSELGRRLGIASQSISEWRRVPADRVIDIERITGIPRSVLRPDLHPPEPSR